MDHIVSDDLCDDAYDDSLSSFEGDGEEDSIEIDADKRVIIEKNDRSLYDFHRWYKNGRLIVNPEWQRNFVWKLKRSSKLIESFLLDIPVPVVYLAINDDGKYEVIDGLQRLTSVFRFFDGEYKMTGLEILTEYNGKGFSQLPEEVQYKIQDVTLRSFELSPRTSKDILFKIFERLNTGGVALNRMEIRNCVYRGALNNLISDLAGDPDFVRCTNQVGLKDRMRDRELVLRFLAFYEKTFSKCKQGLGKFFNDFYKTYQYADDDKLKDFRNAFRKSMKASCTIFGDKGFRLRSRKAGWSPRVNAAVYQAVSVSFTDYDLSQLTRRADAIYEEFNDMISSDKAWVECVTSQTANPQNVQYVFSTWNERLRKAVGEEDRNDSVRCFSRALKEDMFAQNSTCAICGQAIRLIDDAALDHELHYWRGGRTIPENARLTHRGCNSRRDK